MKTQRTDFTFVIVAYGRYKVIYTSPKTRKQWTAITNDMELIDNTKNSESPKLKDLNQLKRKIKNYSNIENLKK